MWPQEDQEEIRQLRTQNQQYLEDYAAIRQSFESLIRTNREAAAEE